VVAPESVLVQPIAHSLQRWPRQACGVQPAGPREFDLVFDRLAGKHGRDPLLADRLPDRARFDLREVLRQRLHGPLYLAYAFETQLLVLGLLLQLRVSRQRHHADESKNCDRHQHFEQREAALADRATGRPVWELAETHSSASVGKPGASPGVLPGTGAGSSVPSPSLSPSVPGAPVPAHCVPPPPPPPTASP
jgi:hypothetical protein